MPFKSGGSGGAALTLHEIYALGLAGTPATDNRMDGTYFRAYVDLVGNGIDIFQPAATSDFDTHFTLRSQRNTAVQGLVMVSADWRTKYTGGTNTDGGMEERYSLVSDTDVAAQIAFHQVYSKPSSGNTLGYYDPVLPATTYDGPLTWERWFLLDRRGGGNRAIGFHNSDGVSWRQCIVPGGAGPAETIFAEQYSLAGFGGVPAVGAGVRIGLVSGGPLDSIVSIAGADFNMTAENLGSAQAAGAGKLWGATLLDGRINVLAWEPGLVSLVPFAPGAGGTFCALVLGAGDSSAVSAAGTARLRYDAAANEIQYSKNGGAWTLLV